MILDPRSYILRGQLTRNGTEAELVFELAMHALPVIDVIDEVLYVSH